MKIVCPFCKTEREIEHICGPRNIECLCGRKFPLDKNCISEEFSAIDLQIPENIGRYRILDFIGSGGMGKVYLAHHPDLGISVALKQLKQEYSGDARACSRFLRSAKISAKLNHPNIVRIYDCGRTENNTVFQVMEYISGGSTLDILYEKGPLTPEKTAKIALQVCAGLTEAEKKKIVHRDIKPENIMFDSDGTIKLLDLGLAGFSDRSKKNTDLTETAVNTSLGTPEYCSPEQLLDAKSCDRRSDIYSLGASMYHLLTGKYPFGTGTAEELRKRQYSSELLPPGTYQNSIPQEMERIVMKCMKKNRSDRYQSASDLSRDLKIFLDSSRRKKNTQFSSFFLYLKRREQVFNSVVFRKLPFWKYPAEKTLLLSPFRLMIFFIIIILAAGISAAFPGNHSGNSVLQSGKNVKQDIQK
ncbi:MAG: serine/threonine protein kinase [Lentisphaeria bacterium]|nr:serine/threonine protein kinase [Lentisphaeria bacterium]